MKTWSDPREPWEAVEHIPANLRCHSQQHVMRTTVSSSIVQNSHLFPLGKEIRDFGWKNKRAPIVALDELDNHLGCFLRQVLLKKMACSRKYLKLEFPLNALDT